MQSFPPVASRNDVTLDALKQAMDGLDHPMIFRGAARDWPVVQAAIAGTDTLVEHLKARDAGRPAETFRQAPGSGGKYFYADKGRGFNFARAAIPLTLTLERLRRPDAEPIYIQSALLKDFFPRLKAENVLPGIGAEPRIWIGNRSLTQIHFDLYDNLACMVAGHKRFVLFPPDQVKNLYMGPFETTISGVPTAMADLENPDFAAHPRFAEALKTATVADLEPGDILFIPYMWWHHVVSDGAFNVQINYWWDDAPREAGVPIHALFHAMVSLRDLSPARNAAWKAMFDHFVFHQNDPVGDHLPPELRGLQGEMTPEQRKIFLAQLGRNMIED